MLVYAINKSRANPQEIIAGLVEGSLTGKKRLYRAVPRIRWCNLPIRQH